MKQPLKNKIFRHSEAWLCKPKNLLINLLSVRCFAALSMTLTLICASSLTATAQQARYRTKIIEFEPRGTPATASGKGQLFYRDSDDLLCIKNPDGTVTCFSAIGDTSLWQRNGTDIFPKSTTTRNVGIGTITPQAKLHISNGNMTALFGTEIYFVVGNDTIGITNDGITAYSNIGGGSGYLATLEDTILNFKVTRGDTIGEYINYGWAWGLAGSTASADSVARLRWDGRARAWKFGIDGGNTALKINAFDETVQIPAFAGSAQKLISANATGTLDTSAGLSAYTIDANENMYAGGTSTLNNCSGCAFNFVTGISAGGNLTDGTQNVIVGYFADANASSSENVVVGFGASANGNNIIAIGAGAGGNSGDIELLAGANTIEIDSSAGTFTVSRAANSYFGNNSVSASPLNHTINSTGGSGTNIGGANMTIAAGRPTGSGTPGELIFQTAPTGAGGTTLRTLANAGKFDASTTAGQTRFFLYDVDNGTLERVTVGAADSGGAGFKVLRIPN